MVNFQSPVTNRVEQHGPVSGFAAQAANVAGDVVELAELQARLAKADAKQAVNQAKLPILAIIVGSCMAIASLPVLTLGIASLLQAVTPLTLWQSQLIVGVITAIAALLLIYWAIKAAARSLLRFQRSAEQFANNVAWLKCTLRPSTSQNGSHKV